MSFVSASESLKVKKFESQNEVDEKRRLKQEQWEKTRKPDDPEECPEEETRTLYQQLQDNKEIKEREYEEQNRLRNSIKGLEEEEVKFLEHVSSCQMQLQREREQEETALFEELKEAASKRTTEKSAPATESKKLSSVSGTALINKKSQQSLLLGAIKRKSVDKMEDTKRQKQSKDEALSNEILSEATPNLDITPNTDKLMALIDPSAQVAQVAGILPGIGVYDVNTSDSESSSAESDIEDYMVTRKIVYAKVHVQEN
ncbi:protein FAM192A-like [Pomacea canaliculata]|uniref:protein FAM192A-like n=1 Tax=Pomacea canaliculata TaxID=400727 RepID=UPI000D736A36|nr:protein FAM192A-like [Pomacea canaliculata]